MGLCTKHGLHFFLQEGAMSDNIDTRILRFTVVGADDLKNNPLYFSPAGH